MVMENISILYVRFDIDAVEKKFNAGAYGWACYKTVFRNVPADLLQGSQVSMGDSYATLSGRENVCIIGLSAPAEQLQSIRQVLSQNAEFKSVSASNPFASASDGVTEPLVSDGLYTKDGGQLTDWAKNAYDSLKKDPEETTDRNNLQELTEEDQLQKQEENTETKKERSMKKSDYVKAGINITIGALILFATIPLMLSYGVKGSQLAFMFIMGILWLVVGGATARIPLAETEGSKGLRVTNNVLFIIICVMMIFSFITMILVRK
jgi:hypothetical protein